MIKQWSLAFGPPGREVTKCILVVTASSWVKEESMRPSRHTNMTYLMVQTGNFISTLEK